MLYQVSSKDRPVQEVAPARGRDRLKWTIGHAEHVSKHSAPNESMGISTRR